MHLLHQASTREQLKESEVGEREQMNQGEPASLPSECLGICLIRNLEECDTHRGALKMKDFSDSDFVLLAVIGQRIWDFR